MAGSAAQGQRENLWAAEPANVVRLVTDGDVEDKIAYLVANPVAAGLVRQPDAWPGFLAWGAKTFQVTRPTAYFSSDGTCPETLPLVIVSPPRHNDEDLSLAEWLARVGSLVATKVAAAHQAVHKAGREFLGASTVLSASFIRRASSYEDKRGVVPTFAARVQSVRDQLRQVEQDFRRRYQAARETWQSGAREVSFPFGTWWMKVFHGAHVEAAARTAA